MGVRSRAGARPEPGRRPCGAVGPCIGAGNRTRPTGRTRPGVNDKHGNELEPCGCIRLPGPPPHPITRPMVVVFRSGHGTDRRACEPIRVSQASHQILTTERPNRSSPIAADRRDALALTRQGSAYLGVIVEQTIPVRPTHQRPDEAFFGATSWEPTNPSARAAHLGAGGPARRGAVSGRSAGPDPTRRARPSGARCGAKRRRDRRTLPEQVTFQIAVPPGYEHMSLDEVRGHFRRRPAARPPKRRALRPEPERRPDRRTPPQQVTFQIAVPPGYEHIAGPGPPQTVVLPNEASFTLDTRASVQSCDASKSLLGPGACRFRGLLRKGRQPLACLHS